MKRATMRPGLPAPHSVPSRRVDERTQRCPNDRSSSSTVDTVGMKMGMNCDWTLPLMPTITYLRFLFAQLVPLRGCL
jgi:hypothetical protein